MEIVITELSWKARQSSLEASLQRDYRYRESERYTYAFCVRRRGGCYESLIKAKLEARLVQVSDAFFSRLAFFRRIDQSYPVFAIRIAHRRGRACGPRSIIATIAMQQREPRPSLRNRLTAGTNYSLSCCKNQSLIYEYIISQTSRQATGSTCVSCDLAILIIGNKRTPVDTTHGRKPPPLSLILHEKL